MDKNPIRPVVMHPDDISFFKGVCGSVWRLITPETAPVKALSTALVHIDVKGQSTPHHHKVIEEIYYILDGEGLLRVGDEEYRIKQGTIAYIPPEVIHTLINVGKRGLKLLVIDHPPYDPADTYCVGGQVK